MAATAKMPTKIVREAFFVQVPTPDSTPTFHNVTDHVGKPMPFSGPRATCGMAVSEINDPDSRANGGPAGVVAFSLLHLTKRTAKNIVDKPIEIPRGPLAMLSRKAAMLGPLPTDALLAEVVVTSNEKNEDGTTRQDTYARPLSLHRDPTGLASLEAYETDVFELPTRAVRITLFLASPAVPRTLAVGFIGHIGKPGNQCTLEHAVGRVLFSLTQLTEFRVLSGIEAVSVPAPPTAKIAKPVVRRPEDQAAVSIPVRLFGSDLNPVAEGDLVVEVDLENANPASSRLLYRYHPSPELEPHFERYYSIIDMSVSGEVTRQLGADDVASITYDIVLGSVEGKDVERLRQALESLATGVDFSPEQWRRRVSA